METAGDTEKGANIGASQFASVPCRRKRQVSFEATGLDQSRRPSTQLSQRPSLPIPAWHSSPRLHHVTSTLFPCPALAGGAAPRGLAPAGGGYRH